jgi:hypothetical protein
MRQYIMKAIQDDAQRAGERERLLLEARRAHVARRPRAGPAVLVSRLARLLFRQATAQDTVGRAPVNRTARRLHAAIGYTVLERHEVLVDDGAAAEQTLPPLGPNRTI